MKRITTIICSIAFVIAGVLLVHTKNVEGEWSYKAANAANPQVVNIPALLPYDSSSNHTNNVQSNTVDTIRDTVHMTICDVSCVANRTKTKQAHKKILTTPDTISSQAKIDIDTLYVSKPVILIPKKDTTTIAK